MKQEKQVLVSRRRAEVGEAGGGGVGEAEQEWILKQEVKVVGEAGGTGLGEAGGKGSGEAEE